MQCFATCCLCLYDVVGVVLFSVHVAMHACGQYACGCLSKTSLCLPFQPIEELVKEMCVALQDLRAVRVCGDLEHPSDQAFSQQAEMADQACSALSQQVLY